MSATIPADDRIPFRILIRVYLLPSARILSPTMS